MNHNSTFQFRKARVRVRSDIERDSQKDDSQTTHETTNQEPEWLRRLRRAITAVIVIGSVMWVALFLGVSFNWPNTDRPFNAEQWRTADARQRGRFVRDLLWSDVLMDQPQDRVIDLLGPPDHADNVEILYKVDYGYWFFPWRSKVTIGLDGEPAKVVSVLTIR